MKAILIELRGLGLSFRDVTDCPERGIDEDDLFNLNDALFSALSHELGADAMKDYMPTGTATPDPDAWGPDSWLFGGMPGDKGRFIQAVNDWNRQDAGRVNLTYRGLGSKLETGADGIVTGLALRNPERWAILYIV